MAPSSPLSTSRRPGPVRKCLGCDRQELQQCVAGGDGLLGAVHRSVNLNPWLVSGSRTDVINFHDF